MNRWKTFLKNRKQSDRVKIMLYLGIAAAVFLVLTAFDIAELVRQLNTPAEYVLSAFSVSDAGLKQLTDIDGVAAATPSADRSLKVKYRAAETGIEAICVSGEYAKSVYGAEHRGEMMTVFANGRAYERILAELGGSRDSGGEIIAEYLDGDRYKACRIVRIDCETGGEAPFAFTVEADSALKARAGGIRVFVPKQDTEQAAADRIQALGFGIENHGDILAFQNRIDRLFLEIKYHLIIVGMCGLWIWTLRKFPAEKQR